ncbi:hypothetical protein GCM10010343_71110 [Streptomyces avidinii]|nr:hypothetical protein GCM10010343_71110 [Streptomyces avidinii]
MTGRRALRGSPPPRPFPKPGSARTRASNAGEAESPAPPAMGARGPGAEPPSRRTGLHNSPPAQTRTRTERGIA